MLNGYKCRKVDSLLRELFKYLITKLNKDSENKIKNYNRPKIMLKLIRIERKGYLLM